MAEGLAVGGRTVSPLFLIPFTYETPKVKC